MAPMPLSTYYRAPAAAIPVTVRVDRLNRAPRYHMGARIGDGELMVAEACNLDDATGLTTLSETDADAELFKARRTQLCRRCYPNGWRFEP